jgi:DNA invertase Pin-like site-specific DNA recombinase
MNSARVPVAILVRVSTAKQETQRQIAELQTYAERQRYNVVEICHETISGSADDADRHGLRRVEELARAKKIKKVLVHEISRLARKNSVAHGFVETLEACGVSLYWHAQSIETLLPNGRRNPAAGIMLALLAEMARNELETLRARINSGLAEARREGVSLGRPKGTTLSREALLRKHKDVCRLLTAGHSIRNAAKIAGKGVSTVQRVAAALYPERRESGLRVFGQSSDFWNTRLGDSAASQRTMKRRAEDSPTIFRTHEKAPPGPNLARSGRRDLYA